MELCLRVIWFGAGCYFFYSFPIATNYPKYRHIVSPLSWMFWGIPDTAELAISQLQEKTVKRDASRLASPKNKGQNARSSHEASDLDCDSLPPSIDTARPDCQVTLSQDPPSPTRTIESIRSSDTLTFRTILLPTHTPAHITLTRSHITLKAENQPPFSQPYSTLLEIRKVEISTDSNQNSSSADTNKFSRATHVAKWLEKTANVQLLPDGLGFVFLQEDNRSSNHLSDLQDQQVVSSTQDHATYKHAPTPESASYSGPLPNILALPHQSPPNSNPNPQSANKNTADKTEFTLILNKPDRDKIFTVVLGWSALPWQPLFSMNRQNRLGHRRTKAEGNRNLDDAIKKALS